MPWIIALLALGGLGLAASSRKPSMPTGPVDFDLVRLWAEDRGLVTYRMGPGWDAQTACFSKLSCGRTVDVLVDAQGNFWRPDGAGSGRCSSGADLKRAFLAWQRTLG